MPLIDLFKTSHEQLVKAAIKACHTECYIVASETKTFNAGESPDVIGWNGQGKSILYECKSSLEDFHQDQKKMFRKFPELGMGERRYYFTYPDLLKPIMLEKLGWGLYELHGKRVVKVRESKFFKCNKTKETELLVSLLRRVGHVIPSDFGIIIDNTMKEGSPNGLSILKPQE